MNNTIHKIFGYALREDVEKEAFSLDRESWEKIYQLLKKHDLSHLIGYALKASDTEIEGDIRAVFDNKMNMALFRYVKIACELEAITYVLEKAQVRFMPLKGSVIRKYYKEPWLRTSCDIDVLIAKEDVERVKGIFVDELKYTYDSSWNYEHSFHTPAKIHIELHHVLSDEDQAVDHALSTVWERSHPAEGHSYLYEMRDEMYYLYHIAHMAKHFLCGGCGIRPFLDIWVLNHKCEFDRQKRYNLLREAGLLAFAKASEELSEVWVGDKEHTALTERLEAYILSGGTYGTVENRVVVGQAKSGSRLSYLLSRIFLPYDQLKIKFPKLEGRKWLMPLYQVKRWFRIFRKGKLARSVGEVKTATSVSDEENDQIADFLRALGIQ